MALYKDGNPVSGLNSVPRLTLAQYNALTTKPEFWVRIDAPEDYGKISADQVSYDENTTVEDKLDELSDSITVNTFNLNVDVTANTTVTTSIDWGNIDRSKILYSWVWWSNPTNDSPTAITTYYNGIGVGALNQIVHRWSVAQTVRFKICYIYKA